MTRRIAVAAALALGAVTAIAAAFVAMRSEPSGRGGDSSAPIASSTRGIETDAARDESAPPAASPSPPPSAESAADSTHASDGPEAGDELAAACARATGLDDAPWDEIAVSLARRGSRKEGQPRALQALALDLAGGVPTASAREGGELTHPAVASRILDAILARRDDALTAAQRQQAARLVEESSAELERALDDPADRPRLARVILEVEIKLELLDRLRGILTARQSEVLDDLTAADPDSDRSAPLSPLELLEIREVDAGGSGFRDGLAAELARDFGIEPERAAAIAVALAGELAPLLGVAAAGMPPVERALHAARAQARALEEILRAPELSTQGRQRALRVHQVMLPATQRRGGK